MNTPASIDNPRHILCEDELIRLIKKTRGVYVYVHGIVFNGSGPMTSARVEKKRVIEAIRLGHFEQFVASAGEYDALYLNSEVAPTWLRKRRICARLTKRVAELEDSIGRLRQKPQDTWTASLLESHQRNVAQIKHEIAAAQAWLARPRTQSAAA